MRAHSVSSRVHCGRASKGVSWTRTPIAAALASTGILVLVRHTSAAESAWLPTKLDSVGVDGYDTACANDYKYGTTRIVQCASGTPTTTQIAFNSGYGKGKNMDEVTPRPKAFITIQDHSVSLVPSDPSAPWKAWNKPQSGYSNTNWGGNVGDFVAQGHLTYYGDKDGDGQTGQHAVRSAMQYGYISYAAKDKCDESTRSLIASNSDEELLANHPFSQDDIDLTRKHCNGTFDQTLGENTFLIGGGGSTQYYLNGCPNYAPGNTSANMNWECPRVPLVPGSYKFSIMGLLHGSMINGDHTGSPPGSYSGDPNNGEETYQVDLADYKSLVLTSTLDITNVGENTTVRAAWVELANGTEVNFTDITNTTNLAGSTMRFVSPGSGEGEIFMKFSPYYSTGNYTRDTADVIREFGSIPCNSGGGQGACHRDLTGFEKPPDSFPMGADPSIKKMGKGGMAEMPLINCGNGFGYPLDAPHMNFQTLCNISKYDGATESPKSSKSELASMAGAPSLEVTEVRPVKIYLRKHGGCSGRPESPAGQDSSGTKGITWPNAPADCPAWYLASQDGTSWTSEQSETRDGNTWTIENEWLMDCEDGDLRCYLIDIHLDLEYSNGTRTVLGNPENDAGASNYGWAKGTFFMYDPEVGTTSAAASAAAAAAAAAKKKNEGPGVAVIAGVAAGGVAVVGLSAFGAKALMSKYAAGKAARAAAPV